MKNGDSPERVMRFGLFFVVGYINQVVFYGNIFFIFLKYNQVSRHSNLCAAEGSLCAGKQDLCSANDLLCAGKHTLCSTY